MRVYTNPLKRRILAGQKNDAYLGFAVKTGRITYGGELVSRLKKGVYLVVIDASAQKNTTNTAFNVARKFNVPVMVCDHLDSAANKKDCKIVAVRDKNLAEAMIKNVGEAYKITEAIDG